MTLDQEAKFWAKVVADPGSGCWIWCGSRLRGYGQVSVVGKTRFAHRVLYEHERGPIPPGLTLDHLCRNPSCVNPAHLEAVTHRENILRGTGLAAENARKTHCIKGHEFNEKNTGTRGRWMRACLVCKKGYNAKRPSAAQKRASAEVCGA